MSLIVIFTLAMPLQSFAANMDQALENAIKIAKTKFEIPKDYSFTNSISTDGAKKVFYLNWNNNDNTNMKSINVRIDENGMILGYDSYSQDDYVLTKKLAAISRQDAKIKADGIINKIDPKLLSQLNYQESSQNNLLDSSYYLNYYRVVNGIPFYNDQVSISINRETGKMLNYNRQWTDVSSFPAVVNVKTPAQAQEAYKTNLGLKLIYKYSYTDNKIKTYAVYIPVYDNGMYAVNAFTGDRIQVGNNYYGPYYDRGMGGVAFNTSMKSAEAAAVTLNPDEIKAVEDAAKLKTLDEAEKIARDTKYLGLTDEFKLTYSSLNQNYPARSEYIWNLNFNKEDKENPGASIYISAGINANTGVMQNFYRSFPYVQDAKAKYDQAASKAAVEEFLSQNYPEYYKQVKYNEFANNNIIYSGTEKPQNYYLTYDRMVNGIAFPDNGLNVNYDAVNGAVTSFNLNWFTTEFPAVDKAIPVSTAYSKLFSDIGLGLEYKVKILAPVTDAKILPQPTQTKADVELVYALKPGKPIFVDAFTGGMLSYDGTPYIEVKPVSYTDIKGNPAEKKIMVLAENGVYLEGTEFKPNTDITQKDFLTLLSKTMSYYGPIITPKSSTKDVDDLYVFLTREGVIKQGEKAPTAIVTNEEAVKYIIRAMKLDKAADLKGIYISSFKDRTKISSSLTGYVTLAAGFKIVTGTRGYFYPKTKLTRAGAAELIYNYLQV